ncbi:hypothetical protein LJB91_02380 [Bacteroidales bacterium OttesenSCG-928-L03]|nr:hypothetical protein [Bacteroidales bacterium OttesenSCG-928-L03]
MVKKRKSRASVRYESPSQLTLAGFETPFDQSLIPKNRWVVLAGLIIKHLCHLDDRETVDQLSENIYM